MGGRKKNIVRLMRDITKDAEKQESYGTGLVGEALIISSYKKMKINDLVKMRFIINKLIKRKKEFKRANKKGQTIVESLILLCVILLVVLIVIGVLFVR